MLYGTFATILYTIVIVAIFWFYYFIHSKITSGTQIKFYSAIHKADLVYVLKSWLWMIGFMLVFGLLISWIESGTTGNQATLLAMLDKSQSWVLIFYILIFAPIFETVILSGLLGEVIYWWFFKMGLANRSRISPLMISVILTGFLFGALHAAAAVSFVDYILSLLVYGAFGGFMTYMNLKTKDIRLPVLAHMLYNGFSLAIIFLLL